MCGGFCPFIAEEKEAAALGQQHGRHDGNHITTGQPAKVVPGSRYQTDGRVPVMSSMGNALVDLHFD
jgi:hypothetical protein